MTEMSDRGILFYLAYPQGDDMVFVPQHNVTAIHTVTNQRLLNIRNDTR